MTPGRAAAAGRLGSDAAELGEGGLVADAISIGAGGHQELASDLDTDTMQFDELRGGCAHQCLELVVERLDFVVEGLPAASQVS